MNCRRSLLVLGLSALNACAAPVGAPPLAPRTAEAIDPRVPVVNVVTDRDAQPAVAARLAQLVRSARAGDAAFETALAEARRLAAAAGARESENWSAAQQALSAAVAARSPTTRALGDIDAMAASELARDGGMRTGNYTAIRAALGEVAAIDARQSQGIDALQRRLGG